MSFLFHVLVVLLSITSLCKNSGFFVGATNATCATLSNQVCLSNLEYCHVDYTEGACVSGVPTDGCSGAVNSTVCNTNGCIYDAYISQCFLNLAQDDYVFPCSTWNVTNGYPAQACSFHGCQLDGATGQFCLVYGSPGTSTGTGIPSILVNNTASFGLPSVAQDTTILTGTIVIPLSIVLNEPTWYVFATGSSDSFPYTNLINPGACNSNPFPIATGESPKTVVYAPGAVALTTILIDYVLDHHDLNFSLVEPVEAGDALRAYYGNITVGAQTDDSFLKSVTISSDNSSFIFTYSKDLNTIYSDCSSFGATFTNTGNTIYWGVPLSVLQITSSGSITDSTIDFSVSFSSTGTIVVSEAIAYSPEVVLVASGPTQGDCPSGQQALQMQFNLVFANVFDRSTFVGPRSIADILNHTATSNALLNCYGDHPVSLGATTCNYGAETCTTSLTMMTRCRVISLDGQAFDLCSDANPEDIAADLGSASDSYPVNLNTIHSFVVDPYICQVSDPNDCVSINPSSPGQTVTLSQTIDVFPTAFATVPTLAIEYGILPTPTSTLSANGSITYTGSFANASGSSPIGTPLYALPQTGSFDRLTIMIQFGDSSLLTLYTLSMLLETDNLTISPLDANGTVVSGGLILDWSHFRQFAIYLPREYIASSCPICSVLPACSGLLGCDGFSVPMSNIIALSPALAYEIQVAYEIVLPAPNNNGDGSSRRRRLLQTINGNSATNVQYFYVNSTWFVDDSPSDGSGVITNVATLWESFSLAVKVCIILFPTLALIIVIFIICSCLYNHRPVHSRTSSNRSRRRTGTGNKAK